MSHPASRRGVLAAVAALVTGKALAEGPLDGISRGAGGTSVPVPGVTDGSSIIPGANSGVTYPAVAIDADGWPTCDRKDDCRFVKLTDMIASSDAIYREQCFESDIVNRSGDVVGHTHCPVEVPVPRYVHWRCQTCDKSFYKQDPPFPGMAK